MSNPQKTRFYIQAVVDEKTYDIFVKICKKNYRGHTDQIRKWIAEYWEAEGKKQ